jgi:hypothetical protein
VLFKRGPTCPVEQYLIKATWLERRRLPSGFDDSPRFLLLFVSQTGESRATGGLIYPIKGLYVI